jgi:hypothetical protein
MKKIHIEMCNFWGSNWKLINQRKSWKHASKKSFALKKKKKKKKKRMTMPKKKATKRRLFLNSPPVKKATSIKY